MTTDTLTPKRILKELHEIYLMALGKAQYSVALKIQELLGREVGLFLAKNNAAEKNKISVDALSDEDIARLIEDLEAKLSTLKQK